MANELPVRFDYIHFAKFVGAIICYSTSIVFLPALIDPNGIRYSGSERADEFVLLLSTLVATVLMIYLAITGLLKRSFAPSGYSHTRLFAIIGKDGLALALALGIALPTIETIAGLASPHIITITALKTQISLITAYWSFGLLISCFTEELLWRGAFFASQRQRYGGFAVLVSLVGFSLSHLIISFEPYRLVSAVCLGGPPSYLLYLRYRSLVPAVIFHFLFDTTVSILQGDVRTGMPSPPHGPISMTRLWVFQGCMAIIWTVVWYIWMKRSSMPNTATVV